MSFHTEELGMNLEPLTAKDDIRCLISIVDGYWGSQHQRLIFDCHPRQNINPKFALGITSEA